MNCEAYRLLSPKERIDFIGSLVHAVQNNNEVFKSAKELVDYAVRKRMFDDVIINPTTEEVNHD